MYLQNWDAMQFLKFINNILTNVEKLEKNPTSLWYQPMLCKFGQRARKRKRSHVLLLLLEQNTKSWEGTHPGNNYRPV